MLVSVANGISIVHATENPIVTITPSTDKTIFVYDNIEVAFSNDMDQTTLSNIQILKYVSGSATAITYAGTYADKKYTIRAALEYNSQYKVVVPTTVEDIDGNPVSQEVTSIFNTFAEYHRGIKTAIIDEEFDSQSDSLLNQTPAVYNATTNPNGFNSFVFNSNGYTNLITAANENNVTNKLLKMKYNSAYAYMLGSNNISKLQNKTSMVMSFKYKLISTGTNQEFLLMTHNGTASKKLLKATYGTTLTLFPDETYKITLSNNNFNWTKIDLEIDNLDTSPVCKYVAVNGQIVAASEELNIQNAIYTSDVVQKVYFQNSAWSSGISMEMLLDDVIIYEPIPVETGIPTVQVNEVKVLDNINDFPIDVSANYESQSVVAVNAKNIKTQQLTADLMMGFYDANDTLVDVKTEDDVVISSNGTAQVDFDIYQGSYSSAKIFAWDSALRPLSKSIRIDNNITVYPEESLEIIKNPYRGLMYYTAGMFSTTVLNEPVVQHMGMGYKRMGWSALEPAEGQYDWSVLDDNITLLQSYGMQFGFGVHAAMINTNGTYVQSTPLWVFNAGAAYTTELNGAVKIPVWDDAIFMQKYQNLINAIKTRYNDNPNIAFVDILNYGNWGEWHLMNLTNSVPISDASKQAHIDMWQGAEFPLTMLTNDLKATNYAQDTLNAGIKVCGCLHPNVINEHKVLEKSYDMAASVSEWYAPGYPGYRPGGVWESKIDYMPILFERILREGKPSHMEFGGWNPPLMYSEQPQLANRWSNRIGYWFKLVKAQFPRNFTSGTLEFQMKNDGNAPIYAGSQNEACVKLALMDSSNNILDTVLLQGVDPFDWKPNQIIEESAAYSFANTTGATKLCLGVFTNESLTTPNIKLGSQGTTINGWYELNDMPLTEVNGVGSNKVYSASDEYAEYGYGFHEARYAFDGDNDTSWKSELINGAYLEADFGEVKEVNGFRVNVENTTLHSFQIKSLINGNWETVYSGVRLNAGDNYLPFPAVTTQKIRLVFDAKGVSPTENANELFGNPNFEKDVLVTGDWQNYSNSDIVADTEFVNEGIRSVKIYNRTNVYKGLSHNITKALTQNGTGTYNFEFYTRPAQNSFTVKMYYVVYDDAGSHTGSKLITCSQGAWTKASNSFNITWTGTLYKAFFNIESVANTSTTDLQDLYIDNASMTKQ